MASRFPDVVPSDGPNEVLKRKFRELHSVVVNGITPVSVIDFLFQNSVLSADDMHRLRAVRDSKERCRDLLTLLHTQGNPQAFVQLRRAIELESAYEWIVEQLDQVRLADDNVVYQPQNAHGNAEDMPQIADDYETPVPTTPPPPPPNCKNYRPVDEPDGGVQSGSRPEKLFELNDGEGPVAGLTVLNGKLYVVWESSHNVFVYDVSSAKPPPQRPTLLALPSSRKTKLCDITSCAKNDCLYIGDAGGGKIFVLPAPQTGTKLKHRAWSTEGKPCGLSVTPSNANLLVCIPTEVRLDEYSYEGKVINRINLPSGNIASPWSGIEVGHRRWMICHGGSKHRVCLIDGERKRVGHVHGGSPGSGASRLSEPLSLIVDYRGGILVADCGNNRVKLLNSQLEHVQDLLTGLDSPRRLHLCSAFDVLFVGLSSGRVEAYKGLQL